MIRNYLCVLLFPALLFQIGAAGGSDDSDSLEESYEIIPLKIQHNIPVDTPWHDGFLYVKETLEQEYPGIFDITIYPSGQLAGGDWKVIFDQVQSGTVQMTVESQVTLAAIVPELISLSTPFVFEDMDHVMRFWAERPEEVNDFVDKFQENDLISLGYWPRSPRQLLNSRKPVVVPADIQGMKFRVPAIELFVKTYEVLGANPTPLPSGEIYTAMLLGTVVGEDNALATVYATKTYEQGKYMNIWNYMGDGTFVIVNQDWFSDLPSDYQNSVRDAVQGASELVARGFKELDKLAFENMSKVGIEFTSFTPEMKEPWREVIQPVYKMMEDLVGKETFEKILSTADRTR